MLRLAIIFLLAFAKPLLAAQSYRHKEGRSKGQDYYYIAIGLTIPTSNITSDASSFNISINPNSEIGISLQENDINVNELLSGRQKFSSQKIGAGAYIGYKTTSFLRFDAQIDFLTFSQVLPIQDFPNIGLFSSKNEISYTVRQLAFIGNAYFDFDNPTSFTPYIGAGGGLVFNQVGFLAELGGVSYQDPDNSLIISIPKFVYEFKGGLKVGTRKAYVDFEGFYRKTPALELQSYGLSVKVGFRI